MWNKKKTKIIAGLLAALLLAVALWMGYEPKEQNTQDIAFGATTAAKFPTVSTGAVWTNPNNAFSDNNTCASKVGGNTFQGYDTFGFGIPASSTIDGITVDFEWDYTGSLSDSKLQFKLSWDNGSTFTTAKQSGLNTTNGACAGAGALGSLGGAADTWGRTWNTSEMADGTFEVHVATVSTGQTHHLDYFTATITYTDQTVVAGSNTATQVIIIISRLWGAAKDFHIPTFAELTAPRRFSVTSDGSHVVRREIMPWEAFAQMLYE